jgi:G3E family GTPase
VIQRIPIYLLTGFLGSGKTTLLKAWLKQPALKDAALVINELGETPLDNQLLATAIEVGTLSASCICCEGLPNLEQALETMFWARLERRVPKFSCLVIETTGLADPAPILKALNENPLLAQRYAMAGVITCISAPSFASVIQQHQEACAQLANADLIIVTKTDKVSTDTLALVAQGINQFQNSAGSDIPTMYSANADVPAELVVSQLKTRQPHITASGKAFNHISGTRSFWWPIQKAISTIQIVERIELIKRTLGDQLIRVKGIVTTDNGLVLIQLSPFETTPVIATFSGELNPKLGLTLIVTQGMSQPHKRFILDLIVDHRQGSMVI